MEIKNRAKRQQTAVDFLIKRCDCINFRTSVLYISDTRIHLAQACGIASERMCRNAGTVSRKEKGTLDIL